MNSNFQERLKEGMKLAGIRQTDLARMTGLGKSNISHYINGRYEAKQEALYLIAKALNVNEAWLMGHDVPRERNTAQREADISNESRTMDLVSIHLGAEAGELITCFMQLDNESRIKAVQYLKDLLDASKYRKDDGE